MKKLLTSVLESPAKRRLAINFLSLSFIQAANYLVPLFILPYITRVIGPDNFGALSYAQGFVYYFTIIINYSFDLTATREIAIHRDDKQKVSFIYSNVFFCKLLLFGAASLAFLVTIFTVDKFNEHFQLYVLTYLVNIGFVLFPAWYYQGTERLTRTAIFNFLTKVIFAALVLLFIHQKEDYVLYTFSTSLAQIVVGLIAFLYPFFYHDIRIVRITLHNIKEMFVSGLAIFYANIAVSLYTTTNLIILGFYTSETEIGFFSAAQKLTQVLQSLVIIPMSTTLFPHIAKSFAESRALGVSRIVEYSKIVAAGTAVLATGVFFFAETIVTLLFGEAFKEAALYLKIMAFIPLVSGMNIMITVQGLLNLKKDHLTMRITLITVIVSLALNFIFVPIYKGFATACIQLFLEIFSIILAAYYLRKSLREPV